MKKMAQKNKSSSSMDLSSLKNLTDGKANVLALSLEYAYEGIDFQNRIIRLNGEILEGHFDFIDFAMTQLESMNGKAITIRINSEGGLASEALAIVGRIQQSKCTIITEGYGEIMSAATIILAAGTKGKRRMSRFATFMYHQSSYGTHGKHPDNKVEIEQAEIEEKRWSKWMAEFTNKDSRFWYKIGENKNAYMLPEQCLVLGVIDEII